MNSNCATQACTDEVKPKTRRIHAVGVEFEHENAKETQLVDLPVFFNSCSVRLGLGRRGCLASGRGTISISRTIVVTRVKFRRLTRVRFVCANRVRSEILSRVSSGSQVGRA